jgi:hypothetical protein
LTLPENREITNPSYQTARFEPNLLHDPHGASELSEGENALMIAPGLASSTKNCNAIENLYQQNPAFVRPGAGSGASGRIVESPGALPALA